MCRAKGGIGSGETLCYDVSTVSLPANTYCSCAPCTMVPRVKFSGVCVNRAIDDRPAHTADLLSVVQAATNTERL